MFVCTLNNFVYTFIGGFIVGIVCLGLVIYYTVKRMEKDETDNNI